jgi:hypothetical protein
MSCSFPTLVVEQSPNDAVDTVPEAYFTWVRSTLDAFQNAHFRNENFTEPDRTTYIIELYNVICAYIFSDDNTRSQYSKVGNVRIVVATQYGSNFNGCLQPISKLNEFLRFCIKSDVCNLGAWITLLKNIKHIKYTTIRNPNANFTFTRTRAGTWCWKETVLTSDSTGCTVSFSEKEGEVFQSIYDHVIVHNESGQASYESEQAPIPEAIRLVCEKIGGLRDAFRCNVSVTPFTRAPDIPDGLDSAAWFVQNYFASHHTYYSKFLPTYKLCKEFVEKASVHCNNEAQNQVWITNIQALVANTVPTIANNAKVWDVTTRTFYIVKTTTTSNQLQVFQYEPTNTVGVSRVDVRVLVSSDKLIVPGVVVAKQATTFANEDLLLEAQCVLIRVLYLFKLLMYEPGKVTNLATQLTQVAPKPPTNVTPPGAQIPEQDLALSTNPSQNVPRIDSTTLRDAYNILETPQTSAVTPSATTTTTTTTPTITTTSTTPLPQPPVLSTYILPLKTFGPKLLEARTVAKIDEIVEEMQSASGGVLNLLAREKALQEATGVVSNVRDTISSICEALWTRGESDTTLEFAQVKDFGEAASKYTNAQEVNGTTLDFALKVVYKCCQALKLSVKYEQDKLSLEGIVRYSDNQMTNFGGKFLQRKHGQPGRTERFVEANLPGNSHEAYQNAVQTIYGQNVSRPFTTYGYVLMVVRWLMSVVSGIGQFVEGEYINLQIQDSQDNNVSIVFSKSRVPDININDSKMSCNEHRKWFRHVDDPTTQFVVKNIKTEDLPFVMEYVPITEHQHACPHYFVCKYNLPVQMTPGFKATQQKPWLDKIGLFDIIMYRLDVLEGDGLGVTPFIRQIKDLVVKPTTTPTPVECELKACYQMMDIPSFSSNFEALPIVESYYDMIEKQQTQKMSDMLKDAATNFKNTVAQVRDSLQGRQVDSSNKEVYKTRFVEHILLWLLSGNYALPVVDVAEEYKLQISRIQTQQPIRGGLEPLDSTRIIEDVAESTFKRYSVKHVDKLNNPTFTLYYFRMAKPRFTNLLGLLLGRMNFEPKVAIHVLDMYWNYTPTNDKDEQAFQASKQASFPVDVSSVRQDLGLWWTLPAPPRQPKQATGQAAQQVNQASSKDLQVQENAWLTENNVPSTVKSRKTWQTIINYGFEGLYREVASDPNVDATQRDTLLRNIRNAADNSKPFAYNKNSPSGWDYYFSNLGQRLYVYNDTWTDLRYHKRAQEHAAKRGNQVAQNPNYQQVNQGGIGALPGVGLALGGAAMQHAQSAFRGSTNIFGDQRAQQQQPKGQVTFNHHTTTGQTVTARVNTASELQDDADKRIQRVYADKLSSRARNLTFTDAQGRSVFTLLPHNILAIVLLLVYAILVLYASSIGTSTYTLLNVENTQASSYAANLPDLQKPRMACSTFFGIGVGMLVAFVVSLVEIVNNTRLRQALFIVLMAAPIIVLGAMGVTGASDVCGVNTMTSGESTTSTWSTDQAAQSPVRPVKRKRGTIEQKTPRVAKFFKSLLGTHDSDLDGTAMLGGPPSCTPGGASPVCSNDMKTQCSTSKPCASGVCLTGTCNNDPSAPCATDTDCVDDVTRNNMKASDFFFIGIGIGVLLAGFCTLIPGNPFHPDVHDTMHGLLKQKDFSVSSQIKRHWLIYFGLFSLVLLGGASSSLWLGLATPAVAPKDAKAGETIQGPANTQAGVMIAVSVVLFFAIMAGGMLHRKSHSKLANEVISSGILQGQATSSKVELGQPR